MSAVGATPSESVLRETAVNETLSDLRQTYAEGMRECVESPRIRKAVAFFTFVRRRHTVRS